MPTDKIMHMFTYASGHSSRMWFPSIDSHSEACTWKLEFTVDSSMTAVSSGELIESVYSYDLKKKTFHYMINTPVVAPSIGLAVGAFEVVVDTNMPDVTHFCLPQLRPLVQATCSFLHEIFEFYEELLSSRYPFASYKQVFVDEAYAHSQPYATMAILDTYLLHSKHVIDQTFITRRVLAHSVADQFFGCYISKNTWNDAWLPRGIAGYLALQFHRKVFGNNDYRHQVAEMYKKVIEYEQKNGGIILDNSRHYRLSDPSPFYFSINHFYTYSPHYEEAHRMKACLIIRMLEDRIGKELLMQVFNKLLALAASASQQKVTSSLLNVWNNMLLSTSSFSKAIFTVTGKDISTFLAQWVYIGGHPKFHGRFVFNRKRNTVELEIKQQETMALGIRKYMGPLTVWIQELDGTFKHNLQIEENTTKHDITCHSKSRRNKKKKIPLCTGEEVDMDLSIMDADSPVLWIRVDPEMQLLREVVFEQPDFQWQYQLRYERDIVAQLEAIDQLYKYATPYTRKALTDTIENTHCYYRVRCQAAQCLTVVANQMANTWTGPPAMMSIFKKLFGSYSCPSIIKLNNFSNFQNYFLQKSMPLAMARLRTLHGICPPEVLRFLLDLFKYNDNSKNKFTDNYYRSALVEAIVETLTPVVSAVMDRSISSEALSSEAKLILDEIVRYFNLEKLLPCYHNTVTVSCLKAFRYLQKLGHLPNNPAFFRQYTQYGLFKDIRVTAVEALVDIIKVEQRKDDLLFLLDLVEFDPVPMFRYQVLRQLTVNPPITKKDSQSYLNCEEVVEKVWRLMNSCLSLDCRLRNACVDMYYTFYGRGRPACLPKPEFSLVFNLKVKKASISTSIAYDPLDSSSVRTHDDEEDDRMENLSDHDLLTSDEYSKKRKHESFDQSIEGVSGTPSNGHFDKRMRTDYDASVDKFSSSIRDDPFDAESGPKLDSRYGDNNSSSTIRFGESTGPNETNNQEKAFGNMGYDASSLVHSSRLLEEARAQLEATAEQAELEHKKQLQQQNLAPIELAAGSAEENTPAKLSPAIAAGDSITLTLPKPTFEEAAVVKSKHKEKKSKRDKDKDREGKDEAGVSKEHKKKKKKKNKHKHKHKKDKDRDREAPTATVEDTLQSFKESIAISEAGSSNQSMPAGSPNSPGSP